MEGPVSGIPITVPAGVATIPHGWAKKQRQSGIAKALRITLGRRCTAVGAPYLVPFFAAFFLTFFDFATPV
jgi:hypothetical protein